MSLRGLWKSAKTEWIADYKGIHFFRFLLIRVGSLEIANELWVTLMDGVVQKRKILNGRHEMDLKAHVFSLWIEEAADNVFAVTLSPTARSLASYSPPFFYHWGF